MDEAMSITLAERGGDFQQENHAGRTVLCEVGRCRLTHIKPTFTPQTSWN
jgi:hypothetical protein